MGKYSLYCHLGLCFDVVKHDEMSATWLMMVYLANCDDLFDYFRDHLASCHGNSGDESGGPDVMAAMLESVQYQVSS